MRTPTRPVALGLLFALGFTNSLFAQSRAEELALIFRPFETDHVTLSPDGRHLAYTERAGEKLDLVLRDLDANRLVRVPVGEARAEELSGAREKTPARLTFLQWATAERLVFNLNDRNIWSIKADGSGARRMADASDFAPPPKFDGPQATGGPGAAAAGPDAPGLPRPILETLQPTAQPVRVISLPRGDKYVYVEAVMQDRGLELEIKDAGANFGPGSAGGSALNYNRRQHAAPRGVVRVDVNTGRTKDWGEAEPRALAVLADQQGRPRVSMVRTSERSLAATYNYAAPGGKWTPLDELLGENQAAGFKVSPETQFGVRAVPLAFDYDPDLLYYAANTAGNMHGIYALDLKKRRRTDVAIETPVADFYDPAGPPASPLVFDHARRSLVGVRYTGAERATLWLDPELAGVQRTLTAALPGRTAEIVEWDDLRQRYLVLATSQSDPGTYYLFNAESRTLDECLQRAPWLPESARSRTISFGFVSPEGVPLSGYLTLPRSPRLPRAPLVALCHDGPWSRDQPGYNRWVQALASMGFAVVQVNYRGSSGFGQKHLQALREGPDTVPLADINAAVDWVIKSGRVNPKLVALMGEGYGGYLALRGMQLHPGRFRCAVTVNAPTDLAVWVNPATDAEAEASLGVAIADLPMGGAEPASNDDGRDGIGRSTVSRNLNPQRTPDDDVSTVGVLGRAAPTPLVYAAEQRRGFFGKDLARLRAISPASQPAAVKNPVMLIQADSAATFGGRQFTREVNQVGGTAHFLNLSEDEAADLPLARAALFQQVEGFLNEHIYNYSVKLGETVVLP
jgi:dipeptidyl aminopeptidase/acylaminoacyl peptidase